MAHDVFISYASRDKPVADAVCAALESHKVRCWIAPRDVLPGKKYADAIAEAISGSRLLVLVFSDHSNRSYDVMSEVGCAFRKQITILPFRIDETAPTGGMDYYLGVVHWLDALTPPLERHLRTLAEKVLAHLQIEFVASEARPDRSQNPQARACHERGVAYFHRQEYDQAIAELSESIRLDPTIAWAFNDRGAAWLRKGEFAEAIADLSEGIRLDPSLAWPLHDRGACRLHLGQYEAAIADYTAVVRLDPTMAWSYHDRGVCHLRLGQFDAAVADFTSAIQVNPELAWAYRNRAAAYEKLGRADLAQSDLTKAEQLDLAV
jgi:tetratricopeptide (TPR) repeat protein